MTVPLTDQNRGDFFLKSEIDPPPLQFDRRE